MDRLKELRRNKNLSQKDFAETFHVSQNTVSQWENGTRKPSYDTTEQIANFFDVTMDYLVGRNSADLSKLDNLEFALYGKVKEFDDETKTKLLEYVEFLESKTQGK